MTDSFRDPDYQYPGESIVPSDDGPDIPMDAFPFDPVLRLALIDKGILTPEDLVAADKKIRVTSAIVNNSIREEVQHGNGQSPE